MTAISDTVVIAIIAILAAMLLPALNNARERAKTISCVNVMKQLNTVIHQYTQDSKEYYLPANNSGKMWFEMMLPYLGGAQSGYRLIFGSCGAFRKTEITFNAINGVPSDCYNGPCGYNQWMGMIVEEAGAPSPVKAGGIANNKMIVLCDAEWYHLVYSVSSAASMTSGYIGEARHAGSVNCMYLDHVATVDYNALKVESDFKKNFKRDK